MRNSPLVEGFGAENVTGLKSVTEAVDVQVQRRNSRDQKWSQWRNSRFVGMETGGEASGGESGSFEYCLGVVGERSSGEEGESRGLLERGEVRIPE